MDSRRIEDTAAEWLARRDSEDWSPADESALQSWMSASVAHEVAFLRLEAAWEEAQRLKALGAGTPAGVVPPPGQWHVSPLFDSRAPAADREPDPPAVRWYRRRFVAAAALLLVAGATLFFSAPWWGGQGYTTPVGGLASIPLRDGSNVMLNTHSRIRVDLTPQVRRIELEEGEAFFEVAKDPKRPFTVVSGDKRVVAVGTKFSVRRDADGLQVVVTEGKVRVEDASEPLDLNAPLAGADVLPAGAIARVSHEKVVVDRQSERAAEDTLSWRTGYLIFDATPLSSAVDDFNRYTTRPIVIDDPQVASLPISGKFRANNAEAFARVLHEGFGIHVEEREDSIVLTH